MLVIKSKKEEPDYNVALSVAILLGQNCSSKEQAILVLEIVRKILAIGFTGNLYKV